MTTPTLNEKAPAFKAPASNGKTLTLNDYKGQYVVLYFYPKDDTPGCTKEACNFRDHIKPITNTNAVVLGVSPDPIKKHQKFIEKYSLPFILISDEDHQIAEQYGVWVEKSMYGKKYMGIARTTFIIDPKGTIIKIFEKVKPAGHAEEVLQFLKSI